MPARTFPNLGLKGGYDEHEGGWADDMSLNLLTLSVVAQGVALDIVAEEPGSPTAGDVYILDETNATNPNKIAVFDGPTGEEDWVYITPHEGWMMHNMADGLFYKLNDTAWAEFQAGGGGGDSAYRVGFFVGSSPEADEAILLHVLADNVTISADFAGAYASVATNPAADYTLSVQKNGSEVGTIVIADDGTVTFDSSGVDIVFAPGDVLLIMAPSTTDTAAGIAVTLKGSL